MNGVPLSSNELEKVIALRKTGHSISEIHNITKRGKATISRLIKEVPVLEKYKEILKEKQGGSKVRASKRWKSIREEAQILINDVNLQRQLLVLSCLYWGEGNKKEFSLINSDTDLIKTVLCILIEIGVPIERIKVSLRIYSDLNYESVIKFWSDFLNIPETKFGKVDVIEGKKQGKLKYGMCRIRIQKGEYYFKLIMSMIDLVKLKYKNAAVVQRIERGTPKP